MKLFSKNRAAAFGMAGALALGTVASVGAVAPAVAADTAYTCTSTGGDLTFPVSVSNPFPSSAAVGQEVPAAPVSMGVSIAESQLSLIKLLLVGAGLPTNQLSGTITGADMMVGEQSVPLTGLEAPATAIPATGGMTLPVAGSTTAFTPTQGGSVPIGLPDSFTFVPAGVAAFAMPCTLTGAVSTLGVMQVSGTSEKAASTTIAKLKNAPMTTAKHAKILAKVRTGGAAAAGKVIAKEGKRVLARGTLSDLGRKVLRLPLLKRGSHTIVIKYKGNDTTKVSKDSVTFRVRRA